MPDDPVTPDEKKSPGRPTPEKKEEAKSDLKVDEAVDKSRDKMADKIDQPGGLEIEEMPESSELQERRKKTKNRLQELASVGEPDESAEDAFESEGGLMNMLKEANLSMKHVKFCCGGIVIVLVIIGLIWGGIKFVDYLGDRPEKEVEEVVEDDEDEDEDEVDFSFLDPSVFSGILIGEEEAEEDIATEVGEELGEELVSSDSLAQMIVDFAEMYELMSVDVNELLDASNDRRETLGDYSNELNYLLYIGKQNMEQLSDANDNLVEKYTEAEERKDVLEVRFFDKLKDLDAYGSVALLDEFIIEAEEVVQLRAEYRARQKLLEYYESLLEDMEARVSDIELNEEALVKGVKVVDIEGSDIDLIIQESEL